MVLCLELLISIFSNWQNIEDIQLFCVKLEGALAEYSRTQFKEEKITLANYLHYIVLNRLTEDEKYLKFYIEEFIVYFTLIQKHRNIANVQSYLVDINFFQLNID